MRNLRRWIRHQVDSFVYGYVLTSTGCDLAPVLWPAPPPSPPAMSLFGLEMEVGSLWLGHDNHSELIEGVTGIVADLRRRVDELEGGGSPPPSVPVAFRRERTGPVRLRLLEAADA